VRADVEIEIRLAIQVVGERADDDVGRVSQRIPGGDISGCGITPHRVVPLLPSGDVLRAQHFCIRLGDHEHRRLESGPIPVELEEPQVRLDDRRGMGLQVFCG